MNTVKLGPVPDTVTGNPHPRVVIEARNLAKYYHYTPSSIWSLPKAILYWARYILSGGRNRTMVVKDLSFTIPEGYIVGFLGPNGAGKTTTLKILLNLLRPANGKAFILGRDMSVSYAKVLQEVGALVENPVFYDFLTAEKNLELHSLFYPSSRTLPIDEVLEMVGLSDAKGKRVEQFSTGMKQRLGLAMCFISSPSIIILDEPTTGLDPRGQADVRELIKELHKRTGATILLSSHLLFEVEQLCNYVVIIDRGVLVTQGFTKELLSTEYEVISIGTPEVEKAGKSLRGYPWVVETRITEDSLELVLEKGHTHELGPILVNAGITFTSLIPRRRTLEDFFLSVTENDSDLKKNPPAPSPGGIARC